MPLHRVNTGRVIPGIVIPNTAQRADCQNVMAMLDYADIGRGAGTLHTSGVARLDMQGRTAAGDANLQVQIGGGTVSALLVSNTAQHETNHQNQVGVANAAIGTLNQSMDSGTIWHLNGSIP
ncbi:hypothetical protein D3273_08650 [Lichenibacterium minor]|uniref:Uncharacterized protein n=1 Tax=Lichenibacterium minor TaxID=2316528 RepID=A0A4Q2U7M2_9HYPH|nr:hypothetical protein [Lichenibacterium minor]RYC32450.1 hypothetical protein D3273_08650 [Lichenibacterium minor]